MYCLTTISLPPLTIVLLGHTAQNGEVIDKILAIDEKLSGPRC